MPRVLAACAAVLTLLLAAPASAGCSPLDALPGVTVTSSR